MSASSLTKKQHELLSYIRTHQEMSGVSPSFDEMRGALALRSKSGVHRLVTALEERGFIRRLPNRARAIEVMDKPRLPEPAVLAACPTFTLAQEARRRGLVLGEIRRKTIRVGDVVKETRVFVEAA